MSKIILLFLLFFSLGISAKENTLVLTSTKNLPVEFQLILQGLQSSPLPSEEFQTLKKLIDKIGSSTKKLPKEEIFFIVKSIFYKTLLLAPTSTQKVFFDNSHLKSLAKLSQVTTNPFLKWFFKALQKDALLLSSSPVYRDYLVARNAGKIDKPELKRIDRKVQLLSWWILKITPETPDLLLKTIHPLMQFILNKIDISLSLLITVTPPKVETPNSLTFFIQEEATTDKQITVSSPTVDDIIDSVDSKVPLGSNPETLPLPSTEDWLQSDEPQSELDSAGDF